MRSCYSYSRYRPQTIGQFDPTGRRNCLVDDCGLRVGISRGFEE